MWNPTRFWIFAAFTAGRPYRRQRVSGQSGCLPFIVGEANTPSLFRCGPTSLSLKQRLGQSSVAPPVIVALAHYQFKAVHPFLDGNGRVGRLLITLFLIERQILPTPLLYLSAFCEASRRDYYGACAGSANAGHGTIGWSISCWESLALS